jgi:putative restriction endonuclease
MINFEKEIRSLKVNRNGGIVSLHKPLLLLLAISEVYKGHENRFVFDDIEYELRFLLSKYGLKHTSILRPQYPFVYLGQNHQLWRCSIQREDLKHPDAASRMEVIGSIGKLGDEFYQFLKTPSNAMNCMQLILNEYWPEVYHSDILNDLGIYNDEDVHELKLSIVEQKNNRSKKFVEEVLDAYERKCAVCHQSIRLADTLIGIDACHVWPIQHNGDDDVSNGVALCKIHHWALDRGAISISKDLSLQVSKKLNGNRLTDYFTDYENNQIFIPRNKDSALSLKNVEYHYKYIFVK